jgi:hypothetical protein
MKTYRLDPVDQDVKQFAEDAVRHLKKIDRQLKKKQLSNKFYESEYKGIGTYSTRELVLSWLIYSGLCDKYNIYPENSTCYDASGGHGSKRVDFSLFKRNKVKGKYQARALIEAKGPVGIKKDGTPNQSWGAQLRQDIQKLNGRRNYKRVYNEVELAYPAGTPKYLMAYVYLPEKIVNDEMAYNDLKDNYISVLEDGLPIKLESIDVNAQFSADGEEAFTIMLWRIMKR